MGMRISPHKKPEMKSIAFLFFDSSKKYLAVQFNSLKNAPSKAANSPVYID